MAEASLPSESSDRGVPPFERLLEHAAWLRSLARHLVDDAAAAEDLVQETWLAAIRRPPLATRPLRPWLAGVARRLAAFARRGEGRRRRREAEQPAPGAAPSTDELVARAELQRRLVERVLALREPSRSTVLLCYFEGLAPSEAARALGVPAATMRTRLKRALDELREQFDAEQHQGGVDWRGAFAVFAVKAGGGAIAIVAKAAAIFVLASTGFVAWNAFERAPRGDATPVPVARAARADPTRTVTQDAATAPARVLESPVPEKASSAATIKEVATGRSAPPADDESKTYAEIRGRALLPDGSLAGACSIDFMYMPAPGHGLSGTGASGWETGNFTIILTDADLSSTTPVRMFVRTEVDGRTMSRVVDVPPVSRDDLVIQLVDAPQLHVRVLDEEGLAVETYRCVAPDIWGMTDETEEEDADLARSLTTSQFLHLEGGRIEKHPDGRCDVDLPRDRYVVVIDAPGFARRQIGPFEVEPPLDPPSRNVEIVLTRESPIAGRVVADGQPVEGALVSLNALPPPDRHFVIDELVLSVDPWNDQRVTTDANGSFALPQIDAPHGVRLSVLAKGLARNELTIPSDRLGQCSDLEVELHRGGTLVGKVAHLDARIGPEQLREDGPVVVAERRDLWPRCVRLAADGSFRIEHLSPGPWHVFLPKNGARLEGVDLGKGGSGGVVNQPAPPTEWNVEIHEGAETTITLDASTGVKSR